MIEKTLKQISRKLEALTKSNITLERALDLLEATTQSLEELIAINTLRESLRETPADPIPLRNEAFPVAFQPASRPAAPAPMHA